MLWTNWNATKKNTVTHIGNLSTKTGMEFYFLFFVTFGHNFFASLFNVFFLSMMFGKFLVNSLNHHQSIILYWLIMFELIFLFFLSKFEKIRSSSSSSTTISKIGWSSKQKNSNSNTVITRYWYNTILFIARNKLTGVMTVFEFEFKFEHLEGNAWKRRFFSLVRIPFYIFSFHTFTILISLIIRKGHICCG